MYFIFQHSYFFLLSFIYWHRKKLILRKANGKCFTQIKPLFVTGKGTFDKFRTCVIFQAVFSRFQFHMLLFANHSIFSPVSWERFVVFDRRETSFAASTQIACVSLQMRSKDWYAWNRRIKKRCLRLQCTLGANYRIRAKKNKRKATPGSNPARGGFLERYFRFFFMLTRIAE